MKKRFSFVIAFALAIMSLARPSAALATPTVLYVKDQTAEALFDNTNGCINTTIFIVASKNMSGSIPGSRTRTSGATIDINRIDTCLDVLLMDAHAAASRLNDFEVTPSLNRAEMHTRFRVHDFVTNADFNLEVEMKWRGVGPLTLQNNREHFAADGCVSDSFLFGLSRDATASIQVSGMNRWLVRGSSTAADIMSVISGQVQNGCI